MITFMHRQFREHFCAQYLVGSITLTILDSTAITGGEEQHVRLQGGNFVFLDVQSKVMEVFQLLGFSKSFTFTDSLDEAIAAFKS